MKRGLAVFGLLLIGACSSGPVANVKSKDPYERYLGALEASRSSEAEDMKTLESMLKDPDPFARIGSIIGLAHAQPKGSLGLLTGMLHDPDPAVRTEAVRGIVRYHDPSSVAPLSAVLSDDVTMEVRRAAARELGLYPDSPAVRKALLDAMADTRVEVAYNAHRSLSRLTGRTDLPRDRARAEQALKGS
jgi:HEAT repeat protein